MSQHEPLSHASGYFHTVQDTLDTQRCLVQYLRGSIDSLLTHSLTRLIEQKTKRSDEDDGGKHNNPQADLDGEFATDICEYLIHSCLSSIVH